MKYIGPVETYNILLQRQISEDRLLGQRTTIYFTASSILFLAFTMLSQSSTTLSAVLVNSIRIVLPVLGLFLTILFCSLNRSTVNTLEFLWHAQEKIERTAAFKYMAKNGVAPQTNGWDFTYERKMWVPDKERTWVATPKTKRRWWGRLLFYLFRDLSAKWLPLTFAVLWVASLAIALYAFFT